MKVASFFDALQEFSASVEGDNVEKIAISEGFTRIFNIYCVCLCVCVCVCVMAKLLNCDSLIFAVMTVNVMSHFG
jgi:hypothetical protein